MYRSLALRMVGLCVAGIVLVMAAQMLTLSVDADPVLDRDVVGDAARWVRRSHGGGAEALVGLALVAIGCWLAWTLIGTVRTGGKVLTTRRGNGWTRIDRRSLADSLERSLASVNRDGTVAVKLRRNRRVDITVATRDPHSAEHVDETRAELERLIAERGLPCRPGRVAATAPRRRERSRVR